MKMPLSEHQGLQKMISEAERISNLASRDQERRFEEESTASAYASSEASSEQETQFHPSLEFVSNTSPPNWRFQVGQKRFSALALYLPPWRAFLC
jgi:hypothetical protein